MENLKRPHKGVVRDNRDPKKLGRVKCEVVGLIEGPVDGLPWCFPRNPTGLGGGKNVSGFSVPERGTELEITFPYGDVYYPVYGGYWQSSVTHQDLFDADYPDEYGFRDSQGTYIKVNKKKKEVLIKHGPSGSYVHLDASGNLQVFNSGSTRWKSEGEIVIESGKRIFMKAPRIDYNSRSTPSTPKKGGH